MSDNALYIHVVILNPWFDMSDNFFAPMVMPATGQIQWITHVAAKIKIRVLKWHAVVD